MARLGPALVWIALLAGCGKAPSEKVAESRQAVATATQWSGPVRLAPAAPAQFGQAVALSGGTLLVGDPDAEGQAGAVYFFERNNGEWSHQAITASDGSAQSHFGRSVALAGDTALIGAPDASATGTRSGAVYVLQRSSAGWAQQQKLARDGATSLGRAVALHQGTAVVGSASGSAHVWTGSGATWTWQQELVPDASRAVVDFGCSVAVFGDVALVGARQGIPVGDSDYRPAFVYEREAGVWTQKAILVPPTYLAQAQPVCPSLAFDGTTALIGVSGGNSVEFSVYGAGFVFVRDSDWTLQATLWPGAAARLGDQVGFAVALSGDLALLGAPGIPRGDSGAAHLFQRTGTSWAHTQKLWPSVRDEHFQFGRALALEDDVLVAGAVQAVEVFQPGRDLGAACTSSLQCVSGQCVEGVCCNAACAETCRSCLAARKRSGDGPDGTCGFVAAGTDPRDTCDERPCRPGLCDDNGACLLDARSTECQPAACLSPTRERVAAVCNDFADCLTEPTLVEKDCLAGYACVDGACKTICEADQDCDTDAGFACLEGACKLPLGHPCTDVALCVSGLCADGVCCDTTCGSPCSACSNKYTGMPTGICAPIPADEDPDDECELDQGYPGSCAGDGYCDGTGACRQYAFAGTSCGGSQCVAAVLTELFCNGAGQCLPVLTDCRDGSCGEACGPSVPDPNGPGPNDPDPSEPKDPDEGCSCRMPGSTAPSGRLVAVALLGLSLAVRRRRPQARSRRPSRGP